MENQQNIQEVEIDLREYIKVLIKRKKLILGVFFIAVFVSVIVCLLMPKAYKAVTIIMITPSKVQDTFSPSNVLLDIEKNYSLGGYKTSQLSIFIATHEILLKSSVVLERVIRKLDLKDSSGEPLPVEELASNLEVKLSVDKAKQTNMIQLIATSATPQAAKEIANAWAKEYVEYGQELISGEVKGTGDFVVSQFEIARKNLLDAEQKVIDFNKRYKLDLMRAELGMKKAALKSYRNELAGMELTLKTKKDLLRELKKQIALQEKFIIVSKAITDDALWLASSKEKKRTSIDKSGLRSEIINPIYQDLEKRIVDIEIEIDTLSPRMEYLNKSIDSVQRESRDLENDILQKEFELIQLTREADISKKTYNTFSERIEEVRIIKAVQLGEAKIVSFAVLPRYPAPSSKKSIVVIIGILSLMIGVLLVFFIEFWQKEKKI